MLTKRSLRSSHARAITMVPSRHMSVNSSSTIRQPVPEPSHPGALALEAFANASLELIRSRALMVRTDLKFIGRTAMLDQVLPGLADHYAVIRVAAGCAARYESTYFDTPELRCYHDHRRGRRLRHKVRIRHYPDRELTYLELKSKRSVRVTDKQRLALPFGTSELSLAGRDFLAQRCDLAVDQLVPAVGNSFRRIGLIGLHTAERVTIDLDLGFRYGDVEDDLGGLLVVEVKQHPYQPHSPVLTALHAAGMHERSLSKYTTAIARMVPGIRRNRLLPLLRTLDRIIA